jgi:hypothetical protein
MKESGNDNKGKSTSAVKGRLGLNSSNEVEYIGEEVKFIKRYIAMHGKQKEKMQVLNFINSLQKSIVEKKIRKNSLYAKQIKYIQDNLIKVYNSMDNVVYVKINEKVFNEFKGIVDSEKVRTSVNYIKRYIVAQGKLITKEKAQKLCDIINKAIKTKQIPVNDPYRSRISELLGHLTAFLSKKSKPAVLPIYSATLQGWQEALNNYEDSLSASVLSGVDDNSLSSGAIIKSDDFSKLDFKTHGFTGKWLQLIGDPSTVFSAMIYGLPKSGKSHLAMDLAGYLSNNFGDTLYVAKEEHLGKTLQDKLKRMKIQNSRLHLTDVLPTALSDFKYVILDSVTSMGFKAADLLKLRDEYPHISFIFIFQTRKDGNFRGENGFQHDVDIVIEVVRGKARQMGRFNQGGEMDVFEMPLAA